MTVGTRSVKWAFMAGLDIGTEGDPYLDRLRIVQTPWLGILLHHIHRSDIERDPHDHPWAFLSVVLDGWYLEQVWPDKHDLYHWYIRDRKRWSIRFLGRNRAHKIIDVRKPLWTLVFIGPKRSSWGFYTEEGYVHYKDYSAVRGVGSI